LLVFLHGAGERGSNLDKVKQHGPPKLVTAGKDMPFIVVSPQCPNRLWWPSLSERVKALIDEVVEKYDVDESRIYLTGLSMGGFGTWSISCTYPERFAAIAPVCGGGKTFVAECLKNVPVWAFHGANDIVVNPSESQRMVEAINEAGGDAKMTLYPDTGHDSWTKTYNNEELYRWLLSHSKKYK
jgi:predicted peptidase